MRRVALSIGPFTFAHLQQWRRANKVPVLFRREKIPARILGHIALKVALNITYHGVEHGSEHESEHKMDAGRGCGWLMRRLWRLIRVAVEAANNAGGGCDGWPIRRGAGVVAIMVVDAGGS